MRARLHQAHHHSRAVTNQFAAGEQPDCELARQYATVAALLQHPEMQASVAWVKTKPDDFFIRTRKSTRVRESRR